jgi:hypothetical protein
MRLALLLGLLCVALSQSPAAQQAPPKTTEIEGSAHPELIPDHAVWRSAFLRLSETRRMRGEAELAYDLPLAKADAGVLYAEAVLEPQRDAACASRYRARQEALRQESAPPKAAARALDDITIDCRAKDLDAADRVLDAMSEEGRQILTAWLEKSRRSMTMLVPEHELATYRLPR